MALGTETYIELNISTKKVSIFRRYSYKNKKVINIYYTLFYRVNIALLTSEDRFEILLIVLPK